jgi:lipoprotein-anchoring transpeptidase ErfK/SrfK
MRQISRRGLIRSATAFGTMALAPAGLAAPAPANAEKPPVRNNISVFRTLDWRDHFETLGLSTIIADTTSRALSYWNADGSDYRVYPTSVPISEELTKRGYTKVVRKRVGPDWTPTPSMVERNPELKHMPPGPDNPLGTHAMYLSWPAYLIHGTHDTRKIGRPSSDGCIGLYNEMIEELFAITPVGTQVLIL